jgi:hypothetical protein
MEAIDAHFRIPALFSRKCKKKRASSVIIVILKGQN